MNQQGAACDAASVHFGPTIRRTNVYLLNSGRLKLWLLGVKVIVGVSAPTIPGNETVAEVCSVPSAL